MLLFCYDFISYLRDILPVHKSESICKTITAQPDGTPTPHKMDRTSVSLCSLAPAVKYVGFFLVCFLKNISHPWKNMWHFILLALKPSCFITLLCFWKTKGCKKKKRFVSFFLFFFCLFPCREQSENISQRVIMKQWWLWSGFQQWGVFLNGS